MRKELICKEENYGMCGIYLFLRNQFHEDVFRVRVQ